MSVALIAGIIVIVAFAGIALIQRSGPRVTIIKEEKKDDGDA